MQNHLCSIRPCGGDFDQGRRQGHHNLRAYPALRRVKRDTLRVITRTSCDYAALPLRLAQSQQLVQRATLFEGTRTLQILEFQMQRQASQLRQMMRELAWRNVNRALDAGPC